MKGESSRALPAHYYRDPADVVADNELHALGCKACRHATSIWGWTRCDEPRNEKQAGVPRIGHRCKLFQERG